MPSQKFDPKAQPPSFTALQQHTADSYHALAEAMGLLPDGITVDELIKKAHADQEAIKKAEKFIGGAEKLVEGLTAGFTERIEQLEEELNLARANESIAVLNEEGLAQFHEAVENETRDKFEVRAAKWKYRFLKARRLIRQLQADLEVHRATYEYATTGLLADYDRLTLALSYKWGDAKKRQFLKDIEDDVFMAKLKARWERKFPEEAGEESEA